MKLRPDARPLTPAELAALRRFLRQPRLEEHLDAGEVARRLRLNKRTVLDMARDGRLAGAAKPFPNKVLIPVASVLAWLERHGLSQKQEDAAA